MIAMLSRSQHRREPGQPGPVQGRSDFAVRRSAGAVRRGRQVRRPVRVRPEVVRDAVHWSIQVPV